MSKLIYLAYGSNMNKAQMSGRCPAAKPLGLAFLPDWKLVFRNVADIIPSPGDKCMVSMWEITDACERALDRYEGFNAKSPNQGLYRKTYWTKDATTYMAYVMNKNYGISPPGQFYYDSILNGFKDFGADISYLETALEHSFDNQSGRGYIRKKKRNPASSKPKENKKREPGFWTPDENSPPVPF